MSQEAVSIPELPNIITIISRACGSSPVGAALVKYETIIFSVFVAFALGAFSYFASRRTAERPGRLQCVVEMFVEGVDGMISGILGKEGRHFVPFVGTLFIYIISMNLIALIPFMKSPTSSWSVTLALALCVFCYLQYTSVRRLGAIGYVDHLLGKPRGFMAATVFVPLLMFLLHIVEELVRPISLSLRLRSNIWGDDVLLAVLAGFGLKGVPLLFFNTILAAIAATVQALVFSLLTTIYFALVLVEDEH